MTAPHVIITEQDPALRKVLTKALTLAGYQVRSAANAATVWQWLSEGEGDLVIADNAIPDASVLDLVPRLQKIRPDVPVIVTGPKGLVLDQPSCHVITTPYEVSDVVEAVAQRANTKNPEAVAGTPVVPGQTVLLEGKSSEIEAVRRKIERYAASDHPVVVTGETGTGKTLAARLMHDKSPRRSAPFVSVNCAALKPEEAEQALFGGAQHPDGPGAPGQIAVAARGTLYLKEFPLLSDAVQARLVRFMEEQAEGPSVRVRLIGSSRRDPVQLVAAGLLREDLFYRMNVMSMHLPPLRDRTEDIPALTALTLQTLPSAGLPGGGTLSVSPSAMDRLKTHAWPGNVRELENLLRRLAAIAVDDSIGRDMVEAEFLQSRGDGRLTSDAAPSAETLSEAVERHLQDFFDLHTDMLPSGGLYYRVLRELERPLIRLTLEATRGNQLKASDVLGLNRNTLRKKIRDLNIQVTRGGRSRN